MSTHAMRTPVVVQRRDPLHLPNDDFVLHTPRVVAWTGVSVTQHYLGFGLFCLGGC